MAVKVFSFGAFFCEDAQRLLGDALNFARSQTALFGTRELWVREKELDAAKRRLVEADNRMNTLLAELDLKQREVEDYSTRLATKTRDAAEQRQRRKQVEEAYTKITGGSHAPIPLISNSAAFYTAKGRLGSSGGSVVSDDGGIHAQVPSSLQLQQPQRQLKSWGQGGTGGGTSIVVLPSQSFGGRPGASLTRPLTPFEGNYAAKKGVQRTVQNVGRAGGGGAVWTGDHKK